ncbi:thiamine pyrophosphate-binding protein [Actinoplanes sp. NPDC049596]|uniref:alpha-keto acid decarboxylase family protein n=1 Tax=unclassified Actinoplanes TaxID=2626549 RepID=UPI00343C7706
MIENTVTVAEYLGERLRQAGVSHLFGVPGDFNLNLLDGLAEVPGLRWVGSPNELGAGYAADAYARSRGLAALITTYGVGELSAINAVAGSAAEDAPVLHIVGSPRTSTVEAGSLVHHTLADGEFGHFARAYGEVSGTVGVLTADRAGEQIDAAVLAVRRGRKPGYLSVPQDLALHRIPAAALREPLEWNSDPAAVEAFAAAVRELITAAEKPVLIVGQLAARYRLGARIARMGVPMVTQLAAKGVIDEGTPGYLGDYAGSMLDPGPAAVVDDADVLVHLGAVQTAELTGFFSARPVDDRTVWASATAAGIGDQRFENVLFPDAVEIVAATLEQRPAPEVERARLEQSDELTQAGLWSALQEWLPPHSALVADTGTAYWGALSMRLPADTVFAGQPIWNSIGWALPAVLGQGLAEPDRRPVLVIGDGAAQMTIQELGTIAAHGLRPVILLLNNRGYTIERALQSPQAVYNDVTPWNWRALVAGLTGPETDYHHAGTPTELDKALRAAADHPDRLAFIEVQLDAYDTPPLLRRLAERATAAAKGNS